ncbi:glycoside hydrolase family 71 protein [Chiua virens]|nr:glycoside hydrolase family 71 protein [Chiua virens]
MLVIFVLLTLSFFVDVSLSGPISNRVAYAASTSPASSMPLTKRDSPKYVVAHFMVGNTYPYTQQDWLSDICLAHQSGIDGFALNVGKDPWQPQQVANAYQAAQQSGTGFKLFLSFDMTSLPCNNADDADALRAYIATTQLNRGGTTQFLQQLSGKNAVYFVPSFFVDTKDFQTLRGVIDGLFNWNSGWPIQVNSSSIGLFKAAALDGLIGGAATDKEYIDGLKPLGGSYMAAVSPWFFTHYSPETYNKNWIYLSDDHLYARRWDYLVRFRNQIDIVEVVSWNDFGESHYVGPIKGAQPNSQAWVDGFDHTGWLNLTSYYATAFKTGVYPTITKDQILMWSRPHPALADAPDDPVGRPNNYQIASDKISVIVFAKSPATVTLSTSSTHSKKFNVTAGATKLTLPIEAGGFMKAVLKRNSQTIIDLEPKDFRFDPSPSSYNFNAFVACSS